MTENPSSFTYEYLSGLKFKELQRLSVQFNVNKRWAKKHELIENLLGLKNRVICDKTTTGVKDEDKEWIDGSIVFSDVKANENDSEKEVNRLTFNVTAKSDSRLTYDVPQNGNNLLNQNSKTVDPRQTYEVPPKVEEFGVTSSSYSRDTFEIPQKEKLVPEEVDPRATFDVPQNGKKLLEETNDASKENKKESIDKTESSGPDSGTDDLKLKSEPVIKLTRKKSNEKVQSQQTMLTIPYSRITRRTKKDGERSKHESSPLKMSKKSITIKKSVRQPTCKLDMLKSPSLSSIKKPINKQAIIQSLSKTQPEKMLKSKIPTRLQFSDEKPTADKADKTLIVNESEKENVKKILRRKSKTADEVLVKKTNPVKVSFMSPPVIHRKNQKPCPPLKKTPIKRTDFGSTPGRLHSVNSQTPSARPPLQPKPITATKMPDFNKIHQRQFEQMDSLHDYLKKKEERTKKLFGNSQALTQAKALNKSTPVFHFRSTIGDKSEAKLNKTNENMRSITTPLKRKDNNIKVAQKEAFKSKLPPSKLQTDIKDKNRSHIHGVRTNKRFELQMKFRNM